jgi:ABC-type Fe3+ transport system permease subunit
MLLVMILLGGDPSLAALAGGLQWTAFFYALWEAIFCVSISIGLLVFFRKYLDRQAAFGKFLSTHAYAVYIIHAPLIVGVAYLLQGLHVPQLLKFVIVALITTVLCFVTAYLVRKLPFANRVL